METTQIWENKQRTLETDPQYFGGYLNMARLNIFNINNHLAKDFGLKILPEEGWIKTSFLCDKAQKKLNWNRIFSKAVSFLPILKVFDSELLPKSEKTEMATPGYGKDFAKMSDTLKIVFNELHEFRNDYSHYYSTEKGTVRKTTVSNEMANFLNENFKRAIAYSIERFKDVYSEDDFELASKKEIVNGNTITTEGLVFLTSMFLEREYAFQFIGKIKGLKGTQYMSFKAFREVLMAFCVKLPHEKFKSDDFNQSFTLDIINELNRCPKTLYNIITEEDKKKFRPQLDGDKIANLINNSTGELDLYEEDYDDYIESLTKRVRHGNRFFYFALRYIDELNLLGKYQFHIDLGKLEIDNYPKKFNNEEVERKIVENVKAFGKLSDFSDENEILKKIDINNQLVYFDQFAPHYNTANNKIGLLSKPDIARLRKIKTKEGDEKKNLFQPLPEAFLSLSELQKIVLLEYLQQGEPEKLISDFILTNNSKLMNMQFIEEIKKQMPAEWPVFQKETDTKKRPAYSQKNFDELLNRKKILNKVLAGSNLNDKQIPSKILEYWLNIQDVKKQFTASERIKLMKRDCMQRFKALEKFKLTRKGKIPKIGEMATFLAKDIVDMIISKEKKQKITSFYYDKMQECLALYADPEKKEMFIQIITNELGLFENGGHPFLNKINFNQLRYTRDVYEKYLQEKGLKMIKSYNQRRGTYSETDSSWLRETFYIKVQKEIKGKLKWMTEVVLPEDKSKIPFTLRQLEEKTTYSLTDWLNNVTKGKVAGDGKKPVNLPTNIFDETIVELLKVDLDNKQIEYPGMAKMNELVKIWWQSRGDDVQEFYSAEREYVVFDEIVKFILNSKEKFSDYYQSALNKAFKKKEKKAKAEGKPAPQMEQVEKTFKQAIGGTEKDIRQLQEEDRFCLLMLEKMMGSGKNLELNLKGIDGLLDDTTTIKQVVPGKFFFDINGKEIKDKSNPEIFKTIVASRKGKNYGLLRKFVFDRRLPELFEYFSLEEISLEQLKNELDAYNKAKHIVFDTVFKLEELIVKTEKNEVIQLFIDETGNSKNGNIQHYPYLNWLLNKSHITRNDYVFMSMVRNCFSHNQFPQKKTMELFIENWDSNFAGNIATIYKTKIEQIMQKL